MAIDAILKTAQERARQMRLPYEGALLPAEAYEIWKEASNAALVDVRTHAEWHWVGRIPDAVEIEFLAYPGSQLNASFLPELEQRVSKDALVMFICRSGARSHNTATLATQAGYVRCYNVLEGFEGDKDAAGHRNVKGGWRATGLPWIQS